MITEGIAIKLLGAVSGTVLALVFLPPKTLAGFFRRSVASLICGPIFAPIAHGYLMWSSDWEHWLASAALTSFVSWWCMGLVVTVAKKWISDKAAGEAD